MKESLVSLQPGRQNRSHFLVNDHSEPSLQAGCRTLGQSASIPRASPLVQELLSDGPGQKADQCVLFQRVVQKLLKVVYLRGHIQDQLTLKARVNDENHSIHAPLTGQWSLCTHFSPFAVFTEFLKCTLW